MNFISFDIGGTYIKYGIVNDEGEVLCSERVKTPALEKTEVILKLLFSCVDALKAKYSPRGIGISVPGIVTSEGLIADAIPNIPSLLNCHLKKSLEDYSGLPALVENDAYSAALGELWKGAGSEFDTFFCVTIGTGMGGAFILDRNVYKGMTGRASEITYIRRTKYTEMYEDRATMPSLLKLAKNKFNEDIDGETIFQRAREGKAEYLRILDEWSYEIAGGVADIIAVIDPGVIVIGGAVSVQGEFLLSMIREKLYNFLPERFAENTRLISAKSGNNAGLIGAVYGLINIAK